MNGKAFNMTVERYYIDDSIDKYKVFAGKKELHLQSNIPKIERTEARKRVSWKLVSANFNIGASDDAALAIQRLFRKIEEEVLPRKRSYFNVSHK
jgi:hypothetical protein